MNEGHWRAAISPKILVRSGAPGVTVHNFVTPYDSASEAEAQFAADPETAKSINRAMLNFPSAMPSMSACSNAALV
jgi:hypothetical protein